MTQRTKITVAVLVRREIADVWQAFTDPAAITQWNFASPDWCCPRAANDLKVGGEFSYRMEARDGSMGFDFGGKYVEVSRFARLRYVLGDGREVVIEFDGEDAGTRVTETFVAETTFPEERQRAGWQAILDNFKRFAEQRS